MEPWICPSRPISTLNAQMEMPCVAGMVIQGVADSGNRPYVRKINFGGPAWKDYESDATAVVLMDRRTVPVADFYRDWAAALLGIPASGPIASVFEKIDGRGLPEAVNWFHGPGAVTAVNRPWEQERKRYAFVDELESLRGQVLGGGNLDRFDYWLNTFRAMRAMAEFSCAAGKLDQIMARAC